MSDVNPNDLLRVTLASIGDASLGDALVTTDAAGGVTYLNPIAEELTGWTLADAHGRPLAEIFRIVNESSGAPVDNPADRARREGGVVGLANHTALIARDGAERPITANAAPTRDSGGTIVGAALVFRDGTERKRAEQEEAERVRLTALRADVAEALVTAGPLSDALRRCCEAFVASLGVAAARVWVAEEEARADGEGGRLVLKAGAGVEIPWDEAHDSIRVGEHKIGGIARDRRPLFTNDLTNDLTNDPDPGWARREGMSAFAGFPLLVEDRCVGVLGMFGRQPLSEAARADLAPLAQQLAGFVDRKRIERALRESELRYRMLGEAANDAIWDWEFATDRVAWNEGVRTRFGYAADQIGPEAAWWVEQIHPDDRARVTHGIHEVIDGRDHDGEPGGEDNWEDEYRFRRADGGYATVFDRGRVVREDGRAVRMVGSMFDLTERKRAEETLRQSERRFRVAAEAVGDIIWTNNARGEMEGEQPGWETFTGQTREQYRGYGWADAVHPEDAQPTIDAWKQSVAERREFDFEHRVRRRDGQWRLCTLRAAPVLDEAGEIAEWVGVHADVTEQRRAERRARFLSDLTAATQPLTDPDEVTATTARRLAEHLDADRCAYAEVEGGDAPDATLVITGDHVAGDDAGIDTLVGRRPMAAFGDACVQALNAGEPFVVTDADPRVGPAFSETGVQAAICIPLLKSGVLIAAMAVHQTTPREWTAEEIELVETVVDRCWEALERARTVRELAESEQRYRTLFNAMDQGYCIFEMLFDDDGRPVDYRYLEVNPAFERHTGLHDAAGRSMREMVPGIETHWIESYGRVATTGEPTRFENHAQTMGDSWFDVYAFRVGGADSRKVAVLFQNVTDRKRAEAALRESEAMLSAILDALPVGVIIADARGRILRDNAVNRELWGGTRESPDWHDYGAWVGYWPDSGDRVQAEEWAMTRTLRTGEKVPGEEVEIERFGTGERRTILNSAAPVCDADGRIIAGVVAQLDVTDRTAAESRLREAEEKFRLMADTIPQLAWMARPDGHIFWYNRRWYDYTGTTFEQMEGRGWQSVHDPQVLPDVMERFEASLAAGKTFDMVFPLRGKDGVFRPFLTRMNPLRGEDGKIRFWFGTNTDVSEQERTQAELRTVAARLAEADRRKDEFLATLAHELRNPLAPIRSGLEVLRLAGDTPDAIAAVRETMERQTRQMTRLIDDLLDISRITRGKLQLRRGRVELAEVVRSAVEAVRPVLDEARHEFTLSLPEDPVPLDADAARLAQVFSNLLGNAIKYTPPGGRLSLTAAVAPEPGGQESGGHESGGHESGAHGSKGAGEVVVSVRDNGLGIPAEKRESIFGMFNQLERDGGEEGYAGLGIGLTMVKSLVELHGGEVSVHSGGAGRGSEFRVRLPLPGSPLARTSEPGHDEAGEPAVDRKRRVLVVDDNRAAARMLGMVVKMLGHEVRTAHDGLEAVSVAAEFRPALVLMDLGMPNLNGYEAARRIRDEPWGSDMMLAALTGWGQQEDRRRTAEAGFDRHLVKPAEPAALRELFAALDDDGPPEP